MVILHRCRLCFDHNVNDYLESIFDHYELRMIFERNFGISYRCLLKEKHLALICPHCRIKILMATPEEMEFYREKARLYHHEIFYAETRVHLGLPKNWGKNEDPFIRRTQREPKRVKDRNEEICVIPPKRIKPQMQGNKEFPTKSKRDHHTREHCNDLQNQRKNVITKKIVNEDFSEPKCSNKLEVRKPKRQTKTLQTLYPDMKFYGIQSRISNTNVAAKLNVNGFPRIQNIRIILKNIGLICKPIKQKLFPCQHCSKAFMQKRTFDKHMEVGHPDVAYFPCEICGLGFPTRSLLKFHNQQVHNLNVASKKPISTSLKMKANPKRQTRPLESRFPDMNFNFSRSRLNLAQSNVYVLSNLITSHQNLLPFTDHDYAGTDTASLQQNNSSKALVQLPQNQSSSNVLNESSSTEVETCIVSGVTSEFDKNEIDQALSGSFNAFNDFESDVVETIISDHEYASVNMEPMNMNEDQDVTEVKIEDNHYIEEMECAVINASQQMVEVSHKMNTDETSREDLFKPMQTEKLNLESCEVLQAWSDSFHNSPIMLNRPLKHRNLYSDPSKSTSNEYCEEMIENLYGAS